MHNPFLAALQDRLNLQQQRHLWRTPQIADGFLNFASNDYLGLGNSEALKTITDEAIARYPLGASSSHMVSGHFEVHTLLEKKLADFLVCEDALVFSTGYMANLAVLSVLPEKEDIIYADKYIHASMVDGMQLSAAPFRRYPHMRFDILNEWLTHDSQHRFKLIATEGTFSMEGDEIPVASMLNLLKAHPNTVLILDDAHSIGIKGQAGSGIMPLFSAHPHQVMVVGTLSKALGLQGGFIAGPREVVEALRQFARPYIYTTALSPAIAYAAIHVLEMVKNSDNLRQMLFSNIAYFQQHLSRLGIPFYPNQSAIQIIPIGDEQKTMAIGSALAQEKIKVGAIRTPTVPKGAARLRITLNATHTSDDLDKLIRLLNAFYFI